ncbi:MAG: hypothetical protein GX363_03230 [Clostridiales bacterium]|jgi:DNA-binding SARP family transcriptional activator|nr:hypothetical protein [Clostridiales bacterium]
MLTINMLGKVNITFNGVSIDDKLSQKLVALICLLVLNMDRDMSKEKIASYLWPDSKDDAAKYNLRYNLWMIKKLIPQDENGQNLIISGKNYCRINKDYNFYCDKIKLDQFKVEKQSSVDELIKLKELFKGDFLEGLYLKNCNEFNEMILFERVVCQNKQVEILKKLVDLYDEKERYEDELQILNEIMMIEPYNEIFACRIMDIYMKLGKRGDAINYYKNFEINLRKNLNISPDIEMKAFYQNIMNSPSTRYKPPTRRKKIEIVSHCIENVDYFWVAEVTSGILNNADKNYILELDKKYIFDLGFVQNELLIDYEKFSSEKAEYTTMVPSVRIINAFYKFLSHVSVAYDINIRIINYEDMDTLSRNILNHLDKLNLKNINIDY